jgi:hypothetical protein
MSGDALEVRLLDEGDWEANPNLDFVLKDLARVVEASRVLPATENEHGGVVVGGDGAPSTTERPKFSRS